MGSAAAGRRPQADNFSLHGMTRVRFWDGALFDEHYADVNVQFRPFAKLMLGAYLNVGRMIDLAASKTGRRTIAELWGNTDIGRGLTLNWDLTRQWMRRDGGTAFEATLVNAGGSWAVHPRQRLRLTLQGQRSAARPGAVRGHRQPDLARLGRAAGVFVQGQPRTALYAGASYGAFMDDDNTDLFGNAQRVRGFSYGWQPGTVRPEGRTRPQAETGVSKGDSAISSRRVGAANPPHHERKLGLVPRVHRDDPGAEVPVAAAREARAFHHRLQFILRRVLADRLGEVLVAAGVAGEQLAQRGQHLERVEVVDRLEPVGGDLRELQHPRLPPTFSTRSVSRSAAVLVGDVAQSERDRDQVEAGVGNGSASLHCT